MAAIDYGLNHDQASGDKINLKQVLGVNDLDFDNDKDEVTRDLSMARTSNLSNRSNRPSNLR